jgi:hypothetical protein
MFVGIFLGIPSKFGVLTNQNTTKKVGYKRIMIFASIDVFPLIIVSPIDTDMYHLLLGRGSVSLGTLLWQRPNKGAVRSFLGSVARQRPVSNNREVRSEDPLPREDLLLVQPEFQEGEVGRGRHA